MRILLFTGVLYGGGAERVLCQLANGLSNDNYVVLVASYKQQEEYYIGENVKKYYLADIKNKKSFRQIIKLRGIIKKEKIDICVSFLVASNIKMLIATSMLNVKKIISIRNDPKMEYRNFILRIISKILYRKANGFVFQTTQAREYFSEAIREKSRIIMNPVDPVFFDTPRENELYWVATGRLNTQKNYRLMINAFYELCKEFENEHLKIYGSGPLQNELQELINTLGLNKNISLCGTTNNVQKVLANAKMFLLTSDYEGMPNGLLEAFAMGVPCIATDCPCGGPAMIISDKRDGFLVEPNDMQMLVDRMKVCCKEKDLREKFSNNAKHSAEKYFPEKILNEWKEYLEFVKGWS